MAEYYMFNKPRGCVTARTDALYPTVMDYFPAADRFRLHPVGRLDRDTEGMLLITDDGALTFRLTKPESGVTKQYFFWAFGRPDAAAVKCLESGVVLDRAGTRTRPAKVTLLETRTVAEILPFLDPERRAQYAKNPTGQMTGGYLWLTEGRFHEVKRMLKVVGCTVGYLKRVAIGGVRLDTQLAPGAFRPLTAEEIRQLREHILDNDIKI